MMSAYKPISIEGQPHDMGLDSVGGLSSPHSLVLLVRIFLSALRRLNEKKFQLRIL